ncbi:SDR family NAD(P)-dependent oxidoreductase [Candidatus Omnitrophota bacterium]
MLENKSGRILNVASILGFLPVPLWSVYAATKAYTLHFSEALANELQGTEVIVTCLCPPPTKTSFWGNMGKSKSAKGKMMDAATVAEAGYVALKKGEVMATPGLTGKSLLILARITPRNLLTKMMRSMV